MGIREGNELDELTASVSIVGIISNFVDLTKRGREYEGLCMFHNDTSEGSFKVNEKKGIYKCFACGSSGTALTFLTNIGKSYREAIAMLRGEELIEGNFIPQRHIEKVPLAEFEWVHPQGEITEEDLKHRIYSKPTQTYPYFSYDNEFLGYVLRYEKKDGKKAILPFNYGVCVKEGYEGEYQGKPRGTFFKVGEVTKRYLGFGEVKPMYGEHFLKLHPKATVVIVEGEKVTDWLQKFFDPEKIVVICWQSGTSSVDKVDWSRLASKRVFLVPDNDWSHKDKEGILKTFEDQPSNKAFLWLGDHLTELGCDVNWCDYENPTELPCGFDLADSNWEREEIVEFFKNNSRKYEK